MKSAAQDLDINLKTVHSLANDRFSHLKAVETALATDDTPDYLVTLFGRNNSEKILKLTKEKGVKFFATNSDIPDNLRQYIGHPRQIYKNWIGHIRPDDFHTGNVLAQNLFSTFKAQHSETQQIEMVGISGMRDSAAAFLRNEGLKALAIESEEVTLKQVIYTDWQYQTAFDMVPKLLQRYPKLNAIWCANDELATAVVDSLIKQNAHKYILVGGIDWSHRGIHGVVQKEFTTSIGGHFIEGGIILALLRDHFDDQDFAPHIGTEASFKMDALTPENIQLIGEIVMKNQWHLMDFRKLSQSYTGHREYWSNNYVSIIQNITQNVE